MANLFGRGGTMPPDRGGTMPSTAHRRVTELALGMAMFLVAIKIVAWGMTGAVSLLASAFDSGLDVIASAVNLLAVRVAQIPADDDHGFGHGKAEPLAGLAQTFFIGVSATLLIRQCVMDLAHPVSPDFVWLGVAVSLLSILLTFGLTRLQHRALSLAPSVVVAADRTHYLGDLYLNSGVVLSLLAEYYFNWGWFDGVFGLAVAVYLLWMARGILVDSSHMLMDRELPDAARVAIHKICRSHAEVFGLQNLRTRQSGPDAYIQFDLMLDENLSLAAAHRIGEEIEAEILAQFPAAHILIHHEPVGRA